MKIKVRKIEGGEENKPTGKPITNKERADWNMYVKTLESKGLRGNTELDKGDYGKRVLLDYIKANPSTSLTPERIADIQADFANYRNFALDQVKQGKFVFDKGVNEQNFMQELSKLDAYPGSKTTNHLFPFEYMRYVDKTAGTDTTVNKGFAVMKP